MNRLRPPHLLLTTLLLLAAACDAGAQADLSPQAKACDSNLRTIEGATELLVMEEPDSVSAPVTLELLLAKKMLRTPPQCPAGGAYSIAFVDVSGIRMTEVTCSLHGKVGTIREASAAAPAEPAKAEPASEPAKPEAAAAPPEPVAAPAEPAKAEPTPVAPPAAKRPIPPEEGRKICRANLQELVAAGMMALMKKNVTATLVYTPAQLVAEKFLKRERACPDGGEYTVEITGKSSTATCSKHGGR